ncbi:cation transport protein [Acrasis kona]|uniref:Cation transport protein n=1 Tax=Acrasis kona TaxID=1008807 RepID=A0AAW2ZCM4_9EUKA
MEDRVTLSIETIDGYGTINKSGAKQYTMNEAIEHAGVGRFQMFLLLATGIAWMADSMEFKCFRFTLDSPFSFVVPVLTKEWKLSKDFQEPIISSAVFIGMFFGAMIWGQFSDRFGRRMGVVAFSIFTGIFGLSSAFSTNWIMFMILRGFTGVGAAGSHIPFSLLSEFLSVKLRGKFSTLH